MDPYAQLRFSKTVKIDPSVKAPIDSIKLDPKTLKVLQAKGFEFLTPVQSQSYEHVYSGVDVVARSRTGTPSAPLICTHHLLIGTGKTFAFGLPLIERLVAAGLNERHAGDPSKGLPLVLVLEPTRELAIQVAQELGSVCAAHRMRVQAIFGGASFEMQAKAIRAGVHIVVATPGRALDHITRGTIDLGNVKHVVLDEGDTMLEMGFQKDVEAILSNVKAPGEKSRKLAKSSLDDMMDDDYNDEEFDDEDDDDDDGDFDEDEEDNDEEDDILSTLVEKARKPSSHSSERDVQMLLFSATMPGWICQLTDKHMDNPIFLDAVQEGETRLAQTIEHLAIRLPPVSDRTHAVGAFMEDIILTKGQGGQTIVFTNTKEEADRLGASEFFGQLRTQVIHGDISQNTRQTTIKSFKDGALEVLIATDVAARGLDIAGVDLVVQTAPPMDSDTYVHRSGRTGRAGRNGTCVVLYTGSEERKLNMFENALKFKFGKVGPPSARQITEACAILATKRLEKIDPTVAKYFTSHARQLVKGIKDDEDALYTVDDVEDLLSRCLAAISNRQSITSRSMLTGELNTLTLQVEAVFKNGSSPETTRDWTKLITGILYRTLGLDDIRFGKMTLARGPSRNLCCLIDVPAELGHEVLSMLQTTKLPSGVTIAQCETLPQLISDSPSRYGGDRSYYGRSDDMKERRGRYDGSRRDVSPREFGQKKSTSWGAGSFAKPKRSSWP